MTSPVLAGSYATPVGELAVLTDEAGAVVVSHFGSIAHAARSLGAGWVSRPDAVVEAALDAWASGDGSLLTAVPVAHSGTALQIEIWEAVRAIPSGRTATYGEIALEVGRPRAARAVGTACSLNRTTPFTPCHRVVAASGLGGFGGALEMKRQMLALETS